MTRLSEAGVNSVCTLMQIMMTDQPAVNFITDIKDTIFQGQAINAAGNEAPNDSYYSDREVTWATRRNK